MKAGGFEDEVPAYEGQLADRVTDENYEMQNLMDVRSIVYSFSSKYDQKFSDKVRIYVQAGNGGSGCAAYSRENYGSSNRVERDKL